MQEGHLADAVANCRIPIPSELFEISHRALHQKRTEGRHGLGRGEDLAVRRTAPCAKVRDHLRHDGRSPDCAVHARLLLRRLLLRTHWSPPVDWLTRTRSRNSRAVLGLVAN